jgi:hypothetical protein
MAESIREFFPARSGPWFGALLALAILTFWPTYVGLSPRANSLYTHFHAFVATLWVMLLIAQPMLIRKGNFRLHRKLGKASWVIGPVFMLAVVLLAHHRIVGAEGQAYAIQTYILWLQFSLGGIFALSWALAMAYRKTPALHARFMICTGLTLIDPVVIRGILFLDPFPGLNYQWITFPLTDLVLIGLIWLERHATSGRLVFPAMLVLFVLAQIPALFGMTGQGWWQAVSAWFAGLPLT